MTYQEYYLTERERLIELIEQCSCHYSPPCTGECGECHNVEMYDRNIEHIADHLLANGVIVPPCKVGIRVYRIVPDLSVTWPDPTEYKIIWDNFQLKDIYNFGKTVFLSNEEAEKALAEYKTRSKL